MPTGWSLHVLEARIASEYGEVFEIETADLYELSAPEQSATIDAMIGMQGDFPIVLVDGVGVCVDGIDVDAIAVAVGRALQQAATGDATRS